MIETVWLKRGLAFTAAALAIHSCRPITGCGCSPPEPTFPIAGTVTSASAGPVPVLAVEARAYGASCGTEQQYGAATTTTGADGAYALSVRQPPLDSFCLRVSATTPEGSVSASRDTTLHRTEIRPSAVVRVDLVVP